MKHIDQELQVEYPCRWLYKIISIEGNDLAAAVEQIIEDSDYLLTHSNTSRKGKYVSYNLEITVHTEEARNFFFTALKEHPAIKMVL